MTRYWPDEQLDRITPPQVHDARGRAMLRVLDSFFADQPLLGFHIKDPATCPAEMLPALIAEYSMEEFIEEGFPEDVVRRILKNAWLLKRFKGYDKGVRLGLELLGMEADIEHWHQMVPMGTPNTHRIHILLDAPVFPESTSVFDDREVQAVSSMVEACKRFSQESEINFGLARRARTFCGAGSRVSGQVRNRPGLPEAPRIAAPLSAGASARGSSHLKSPILEAA